MSRTDEGARYRRLSRCVGRNFIGPTAIAGCLDRSGTAWLLVSGCGQVAVRESRAASDLESRKGTITVGHDADFVIWEPQRDFLVNAAALQHRHKLTPYHSERLKGAVRKTFLRGKKIYDDGAFSPQPLGLLLV